MRIGFRWWRCVCSIVIVLVSAVLLVVTGPASPAATLKASPAATPVGSRLATPESTSRATTDSIIVGEVTIEISDDGFAPQRFTSAVGRDITMTLVNVGSRQHSFVIEGLTIDVELAPGEERTIQIDSPALGQYHYTSTSPGDEQFEGTMVVFI